MKLNGSITEQGWRRRELALQSEALAREYLVRICTAPDIEAALRDILWHLGEGLEYDQVYVFEKMDRLHISSTYEQLRAGISSGIDQLPYMEKKDLESWHQELASGGQIILEDIETIWYEEPLLYEFLTPQDTYSIVPSPPLTEGQMHGLLRMGNLPVGKLEHISMLFRVLSNFVSGLANQRELKKLCMKRLPCPQEFDAMRFEREKVPLVDDSKEILQINQRVLKSEGYKLLAASTLWETSELPEKTALDTMVLDVDPPDGDGIAFCQELRETSDIPMTFPTGHAEFSLKREGLEAGDAAYLTKPYRIAELQDAVVVTVSQSKPMEPE